MNSLTVSVYGKKAYDELKKFIDDYAKGAEFSILGNNEYSGLVKFDNELVKIGAFARLFNTKSIIECPSDKLLKKVSDKLSECFSSYYFILVDKESETMFCVDSEGNETAIVDNKIVFNKSNLDLSNDYSFNENTFEALQNALLREGLSITVW